MELRVSSPKQANLSPPDCVSDPEEKELSDEDDDDRNHKHRRREARSQSLERDSVEQVYTRPYRKRNKSFENGHPFRANESQASESWKNYNMTSLEKDLTAKFERKRPGLAPLSRAPLDLNQRMRVNQTFYGDPGTGRGRGRDSGLWNQRDSRFSSVDIASQMVQPAPVAPSLFAGRGLPNVSNAQSASWSAYGLIPGLPNGGLDTLHSIGLQGTLRPPLSSSLNMGITRQRCRDFEERGFCLRGDICPMEHGVNRIVVEDVQSLSQFNLTVPLPSAPLLATPAGPGPLPSVGAPTTLMGSKGTHSKGNKPGMTDDGLGLNGAFSDSATADGADLYDPDQPLWNNNGLETSSTLTGLQPSNDESEPLLNEDSSDHHLVRFGDGVDNERPMRITGSTGGSHSTSPSVWGRIGVKNRSNVKEKTDAALSSSDYIESETKEGKDALSSLHGAFRRGKRSIDENTDSKTVDASAKTQIDAIRNVRKPSQKALRTVFVNGIPQKDNRRESLFSHFRKFGEVVDIYIPLNSERAFIQFSKREEAEAALKAPDAVMGNRFIKLWWANRDSIPDDGIGSGISTSVTPRGVTPASVPAHLSVANKVKDNNFQSAPVMGSTAPASDVSLPASDQPLPVIANSPKVPPPLQKKLDGLEQLKEELRKKQELLDQKRNDFRRKLDKLEKQSGGVKCELGMEQAAKRPKVGVAADLAKGLGRSSDPGGVASPHAEMMAEKNKIVDTVVSHSPKSGTAMVLHESASFKQHIRPLAPVGPPFFMNRYKLDNRPTTFRIVPPLPAGLADVAVLKEHFSSYGDLSAVELEDGKFQDGANGLDTEKNFSALIAFTTRRSAERAFQNGKCWQGHNLQLMWLMSNSFGHDLSNRENSSPALKGSSDADAQKKEKSACNTSQEGTADTENLSSAHKGSSDADAQEDDNLECIVSQEGATAGNVESENSERSSVEHAELHGVFQPGPTTMSGEEVSEGQCLLRKD